MKKEDEFVNTILRYSVKIQKMFFPYKVTVKNITVRSLTAKKLGSKQVIC